MIEKWRWNLCKGDLCGALLTDLSKAFDFIVHDVLIQTYGFPYEVLNIMKITFQIEHMM